MVPDEKEEDDARGTGPRGEWTAKDQKRSPRPLLVQNKRKALGLVLKDVAQVLDLSVERYHRLELNPEGFKGPQLQRLADLFGCEVSDLIETSTAATVIPMGSYRRTVKVYSSTGSDGQFAQEVGEYSPSVATSPRAYAMEVGDNALAGGEWPISKGDWLVIDPAETPKPGDIVHAVDPATGDDVIRIYSPLHPSNPRAPGSILKAVRPSFDEIFIAAADADHIKGPAVELRSVPPWRRA